MMAAVTGASASGKSAFAEQCLMNMGDKRRIYIATMIAWDEECRERIRKHREMRREKNFETLECPLDLQKIRIPENSAVLLECMSNLAANEMYREDMDSVRDAETRAKAAEKRILEGILHIKEQASDLVVVTNEIFQEPGTYGEETEAYRKLMGNLNRKVFSVSDQAFEVAAGIPVSLKEPESLRYSGRGKIHMVLITGGAYQGKADFAFRLAGEKSGGEMDRSLAADGKKDELQKAFRKKIVLNFHEYIRRFSGLEPEKAREEARRFAGELAERNPAVIVTFDEIGCGIVPLSGRDRLWRDLSGEAMQLLAGKAGEVYRVIGGIPQLLKGQGGGRV